MRVVCVDLQVVTGGTTDATETFCYHYNLSLSAFGSFSVCLYICVYTCVFLHLCLCVHATYADPGVFEGLCSSDAFTRVDG